MTSYLSGKRFFTSGCIIDYDAARGMGLDYEKIRSKKERLVLIGSNVPKINSTKKRVAGIESTKAAMTGNIVTAAKHFNVATVYCRAEAAAKLGERMNVVPINKKPMLASTLEELQALYEGEHVTNMRVQPVKEQVEGWLKGIKCNVRLGGSLRKNDAIIGSDVDMLVSVGDDDLKAAERIMKNKTSGKSIPLPKTGVQLSKHKHASLKGINVDIVVTADSNPDHNLHTFEQELVWFNKLKVNFKNIEKAVALLKVWARQRSIHMRGAAAENIIAKACEKHGRKDLTNEDIRLLLLASFSCLQREFVAEHPITGTDLLNDFTPSEWYLISHYAKLEVTAGVVSP